MLHWAVEIVDHELEDGLNVLLGVAGVDGKSGVLSMSATKRSGAANGEREVGGNQVFLTHSPRSRTRRARYMAAAATWLGGYLMKRWSRQPISSRYLPRVRVWMS